MTDNFGTIEHVEWMRLRLVREQFDDDAEGEPKVGEGEPGEDKDEEVV